MDEKHQSSVLPTVRETSQQAKKDNRYQPLLDPHFHPASPDKLPAWLRSTPASPWWHRASSRPAKPISASPSPRRPIFRLQDTRERILLALLLLSTSVFLWASWAPTASDPVEAVLKEVPLIDTHIDLPILLRFQRGNHINNLTSDATWPGQVDFPRLREGKLGGIFWSVFVPCPREDTEDGNGGYDWQAHGEFPDELYTESVSMTFNQIDLVHRLIQRFPDQLSLTTTSSAIFHNHQFPPPYQTIGSLIGGEGLHSIGNRPSNLRLFHQLGMRYMTLTHNCHNAYADAAISPFPAVHGGLSAKGRALVLEMNRMGMMVDLSHVSAATMRDALAVAEAPVLFSHSGARGVNDHPRNVPDDVLDLVRANGGVVQVPFLPDFVSADPADADLAAVADHIVYIGERVGYDHVGIGSDFDGMPTPAAGLEDVSKYPDLLRELWHRGLTTKQLEGVVGRNVLRVLRDVEAVAARSTRLPLEDDLPELKW